MILSARYIVPVSSAPIKNAAILVRNDKIAAIGTLEELRADNPYEEVVDYENACLMPGFINTYTRLGYAAFRGTIPDQPYVPWQSAMQEKATIMDMEDWDNSALIGGLECLSSGYTTISAISRNGSSLHALKELGLRGVIYREFGTMHKKDVDAVLAKASDDVHEWRASVVDDELIEVGISPRSLYSSHPHILKVASEWAQDGTRVALLLATCKEEYDFVRYGSSPFFPTFGEEKEIPSAPFPWLPAGCSPVRYILNWGILDVPNILALHCTKVDDSDIRFLAQRDVAVGWCPRANARLGMGRTPIRKLLKAGVTVGMGTDSPAVASSVEPFSEMRAGLFVQRSSDAHKSVLSVEDILSFHTLSAARALRIDDKVGSIEVGKQADIIAVDFSNHIGSENPVETLVYSCFTGDVRMTMVAGKILYQNGDFPFYHGIERLYAKREQIQHKLRAQ